MELVLQGGFSFVFSKYISKTFIAANYTDDLGYTAVHMSSTSYVLFAGSAWACRRGAPFRRDLDLAIQRLLEAGLINFWMEDVIATHVRNTRDNRNQHEAEQVPGHEAKLLYMDEDGQVVLGLHHLQVTFYLLLLGFGLSLFTFLSQHLLITLH
ncbi:uncharacterized protein [Panulirus ornatus]|uniref:uncharacterized protein n=1 Tax=Panulirus ornatus TaxID=150431 RepID=UPI003A83AFB5